MKLNSLCQMETLNGLRIPQFNITKNKLKTHVSMAVFAHPHILFFMYQSFIIHRIYFSNYSARRIIFIDVYELTDKHISLFKMKWARIIVVAVNLLKHEYLTDFLKTMSKLNKNIYIDSGIEFHIRQVTNFRFYLFLCEASNWSRNMFMNSVPLLDFMFAARWTKFNRCWELNENNVIREPNHLFKRRMEILSYKAMPPLTVVCLRECLETTPKISGVFDEASRLFD